MILDTSVLADIDRGRNLDRLDKIEGSHHIISAATFMEMCVGKHRNSVPPENFDRLSSNLEIVPIDTEVADRAGKIEARLMEEGDRIGVNDAYIAATAMIQNVKLVTADTSDFQKVDGLEIEDWNDL